MFCNLKYVSQYLLNNKELYKSNKTQQNITNKTRAIGGISEIACNFDGATNVLIRSKKHSVHSAREDELVIIGDLRNVRPFQHIDGRAHTSFPHHKPSVVANVDAAKFNEWLDQKSYEFATE
jgi:hypothetical protein